MFEVIVAGGINDGKILGEFYSYSDALDMATAYSFSADVEGKAVVLDQADQEGDKQMSEVEKIDLLCSEHLNGLTTVWAVTKCLDTIDNFLVISEESGIITRQEHTDLINHYVMCAGDIINIILDGMDEWGDVSEH